MKPRKVTPYVILLCISIFVLFIAESFSDIMSNPDSIPSDSPEEIAAVLALVFSEIMFFVGLIGIIVVSAGNRRRAKTFKNVDDAQLKSRDDEIARLSNVVSDLQLALRNEQKKYEKAHWASHDLDVLKEYIENSKVQFTRDYTG